MRTGALLHLTLAVAGLSGCGGDEPTVGPTDAGDAVDAGTDAAGEPEILEPAAPAPPASVDLGPCPSGWIETVGEPVECLPWPANASAACEGASALLPGTTACTPCGRPCPAEGWPEDLPEQGVLYVHPEGTPDAAGTRADPFDSPRAALALSAAGDVVALAIGTWNEIVHVPEGVTLQGACAEGSRLEAEAGPSSIVDVTRGGVVLRELTIGGGQFGVGIHGRLASARLQSVLVEGATTHGIAVWEGGTLDAEDVIVRGTLSRPGALDLGRGINVEGGSSARLVRAAIERNRDVAIFVAEDGSNLEMTDSVVRDTLAEEASGILGRGLEVELGATATVERVVLERNHSAGIFAGDGAAIEIHDVRVIDTQPAAGVNPVGHGIDGAWDATVTGARVVVQGSAESGVDASEGGQIVLEDLVVRDTGPRGSDGAFGRGLSAEGGARLEVRRALVEASHESGVFGGGTGTVLVLSDVVVRDTLPQVSDGEYGRGLSVFDSASLTAERLLVQDNRETGIGLIQTTATLRDVVVSRTSARDSDGAYGRGLVVQNGSVVTLERASVSECSEAGVAVIGAGSRLTALDLDVSDIASAPLGAGRGLAVQGGATAELTRVRLARSREVGLFVSEEGSLVTGHDVLVLDTLQRDCTTDLCAAFEAGIGVGAYADAHATLSGFRVERAALVGLQLARGGTIDLSVGVVAGCPIGANIQTEGFDSARLADQVTYRDNERNFDGATLPLPY